MNSSEVRVFKPHPLRAPAARQAACSLVGTAGRARSGRRPHGVDSLWTDRLSVEPTNRTVTRGEERGGGDEAPTSAGGRGSLGRRWRGDLPCPVRRRRPCGGDAGQEPERLSQAGESGARSPRAQATCWAVAESSHLETRLCFMPPAWS